MEVFVRAKEEIARLERLLNKEQQRTDSLDREVLRIDAKVNRELSSMHVAIREDGLAVAAVQAKVEEVNVVVSKTVTSVTSLAACVASISASRERVDDVIERCQHELQIARSERSTMEKRMDAMESALKRLSDENTALRAQLGLFNDLASEKGSTRSLTASPSRQLRSPEKGGGDSAPARLMTIIVEHERMRRVAADQQDRIESLTTNIDTLTRDLLAADRRIELFQKEETARATERQKLEDMCRTLATRLASSTPTKQMGGKGEQHSPFSLVPTTGFTPCNSSPNSPCDPLKDAAAPATPESVPPAVATPDDSPLNSARSAAAEPARSPPDAPPELAALYAAAEAFLVAVSADAGSGADSSRKMEGDASRPELARLVAAIDGLVAAGARTRPTGLLGRRRPPACLVWELLEAHARDAADFDARRDGSPPAPYAAAAASGRELVRILIDMTEMAQSRGELRGRSPADVSRAQLAAFVRGALNKRVLSETVRAALEHGAESMLATHEAAAPIGDPAVREGASAALVPLRHARPFAYPLGLLFE